MPDLAHHAAPFPTRQELEWAQWWFDTTAPSPDGTTMSVLAERRRPLAGRERPGPMPRPWTSSDSAWLVNTRHEWDRVRLAAAHYALVLATQIARADAWLRRGWPWRDALPAMPVRRWAQSVAGVSPLQPLTVVPDDERQTVDLSLADWGLAELRLHCHALAPGLWPRLIVHWGLPEPVWAAVAVAPDAPAGAQASLARRRAARGWQQSFTWALEAT
ncbi:hypothetical protein AACH06_03895 [Ideonella sp. DXS29W]|uniref:Uncharacterized protein n=1 Tax=Ideonella lacteola TaxID=2984193 RepID=A0ABU9BLZ8_9BURK